MKRASLTQSDEQPGEIDLTPMLDVVFIMLIFFIVTATFIKEPGIDVTRPDAVSAEAVKNQRILVAISNDNKVWINRVMLADHQIRSAIEKLHVENPKGAVVIQADKDSTAETIARVMDAAKQAGVTQVSLATRQ